MLTDNMFELSKYKKINLKVSAFPTEILSLHNIVVVVAGEHESTTTLLKLLAVSNRRDAQWKECGVPWAISMKIYSGQHSGIFVSSLEYQHWLNLLVPKNYHSMKKHE